MPAVEDDEDGSELDNSSPRSDSTNAPTGRSAHPITVTVLSMFVTREDQSFFLDNPALAVGSLCSQSEGEPRS